MSDDTADVWSDSDSDYDHDNEESIYDRVRALKAANEPIPRRLRTHNLRYTATYCSHWAPEDGVREILQNFFDGICSAFGVPLKEVDFCFNERGGAQKKSWTLTWNAYPKDRKSNKDAPEYGRITLNKKSNMLTVTNCNVTLSERILLTGASNKRRYSQMIGGHGEGMKVGILRLIVNDHKVRYRTGGEMWKFFMKLQRGAEEETLYYRTSDSRVSDGNTTVYISDVTQEEFVITSFLPLCPQRIRPVTSSECRDGCLLQSDDPGLACGRFYVKGLFIFKESYLNVSVNLTRASVNRDRELLAGSDELRRMLANIWTTVLKNESAAEQMPFSEQFVEFAQAENGSYEAQMLTCMSSEAAAFVLKYIQKGNSDAFPYEKGNSQDEKLIVSSLHKTPYPCSEGLLKLLMKHPDVTTVAEAQERMFLADSAAAPPSVAQRPLAVLLKSYVSALTKKGVSVRFQKPQSSHILALLKGSELICSEAIVPTEIEDAIKCRDLALKAITAAEQELFKKSNQSDIQKMSFETKRFIAGSTFAELCSLALPKAAESDSESNSQGHGTQLDSAESDEVVASPQNTNAPSTDADVERPLKKAKRASLVPKSEKCVKVDNVVVVSNGANEQANREESDVLHSYSELDDSPDMSGETAPGQDQDQEKENVVERGANSAERRPVGRSRDLKKAELPRRKDAVLRNITNQVSSDENRAQAQTSDGDVAIKDNLNRMNNQANRDKSHLFRLRLGTHNLDVTHSLLPSHKCKFNYEQSTTACASTGENPSEDIMVTRTNLSNVFGRLRAEDHELVMEVRTQKNVGRD